jgi:hypothetical protein
MWLFVSLRILLVTRHNLRKAQGNLNESQQQNHCSKSTQNQLHQIKLCYIYTTHKKVQN